MTVTSKQDRAEPLAPGQPTPDLSSWFTSGAGNRGAHPEIARVLYRHYAETSRLHLLLYWRLSQEPGAMVMVLSKFDDNPAIHSIPRRILDIKWTPEQPRQAQCFTPRGGAFCRRPYALTAIPRNHTATGARFSNILSRSSDPCARLTQVSEATELLHDAYNRSSRETIFRMKHHNHENSHA